MKVESNGFEVMCGGDGSGSLPGVGTLLVGAAALVIVVPLGIFGYLVYKANKDPDTPEEEAAAVARVTEEAKKTGLYGATIETLATAKTKKTMKTPFGFRVPNLARYALPDAESMRGAGQMYSDLKGMPQKA